jgi:hypothetical protein
MPALHEPMNLGDLLKFEGPNLYSREAATVALGQNLALGTVLGFAADGKAHALDLTAIDGTEVAAAVLLTDCDATVAERSDAVVVRRHAIVGRVALVWPAGITNGQKAIAQSQLESRGILVRDSA